MSMVQFPDEATSAFRRQKFKLGELRRQAHRDKKFRESERKVVGRAPDYVGVGVQRAGTSRVHSLITSHPDVEEVFDTSGRVVKEIHWFDQPLSDEPDERDRAYFSWFQVSNEKVVGEFTPRYLYDLWPLDRLCELCPDTKLLILLREPMDRLVSSIQFYDQRGIGADRDTLRESIWRGCYGTQLEYLFGRWPREQVYVGLFEEWNDNPQGELARLYDFLGLDSSFVPEGLQRRVNQSSRRGFDDIAIHSAADLYEADRVRLESVLPDVDFSSWYTKRR